MTAVLGRLYEDNYGDLYHEASPILPGTVDMSTPFMKMRAASGHHSPVRIPFFPASPATAKR